MILELLPERRIKTGIHAKDWKEVVEKSGQLMLEDRLIESTYVKAMCNSIVENGPYVVIGEGVALLHARPEDGVNELGMSLVTLKEPVEFGNKDNDPVKVVFAFCATDNHQHLKAMSELSEVLLQDDSVDTIYQFAEPAEIREYIRQILRNASRR